VEKKLMSENKKKAGIEIRLGGHVILAGQGEFALKGITRVWKRKPGSRRRELVEENTTASYHSNLQSLVNQMLKLEWGGEQAQDLKELKAACDRIDTRLQALIADLQPFKDKLDASKNHTN
jgi:hypothetical protein